MLVSLLGWPSAALLSDLIPFVIRMALANAWFCSIGLRHLPRLLRICGGSTFSGFSLFFFFFSGSSFLMKWCSYVSRDLDIRSKGWSLSLWWDFMAQLIIVALHRVQQQCCTSQSFCWMTILSVCSLRDSYFSLIKEHWGKNPEFSLAWKTIVKLVFWLDFVQKNSFSRRVWVKAPFFKKTKQTKKTVCNF